MRIRFDETRVNQYCLGQVFEFVVTLREKVALGWSV
jgi:hypothetical protein